MKKLFVVLVLVIMCGLATAQEKFSINQYANYVKYQAANLELDALMAKDNRVVFMGNSITEGWRYQRPDFFVDNHYIGRGISGQVTHQMLLRFRADVIDLNPKAVVILAGINDIAHNSGWVTLESIAQNIFSMAELADYHGIQVILCSVLPAIDFPWRPGLEPAGKVVELNKMIKAFADENDFQYVDYYSQMVDDKGGLKVPEFTSERDLVHPNVEGYKVMEKLVKPAIEKALQQ